MCGCLRDPSGPEGCSLSPPDLEREDERTCALSGSSGFGRAATPGIVSDLLPPIRGALLDGRDVTAPGGAGRNIAWAFRFPAARKTMAVRQSLAFMLVRRSCRGWPAASAA